MSHASVRQAQGSNVNSVTLYLNSDGRSFSHVDRGGSSVLSKTLYMAGDHPYLRNIASIKTHEAMLEFLDLRQYDRDFAAAVKFRHYNPWFFSGHKPADRASSHEDTIGDVMSFLDLKIKEKAKIQICFNKVTRCFNSVYQRLNRYSTLPIIGVVPASLMALIGLIQAIAGTILSILSSPLALFSERGEILLKNSLKQAVLGLIAVCNALFRAIFYGALCAGLYTR